MACLLYAVALSVGLMAVSFSAGAQPAAGTTTVRLGSLPISLSNSGLYIAEAKGYFAEQGITLEWSQFRSGDEQVPVLASGDLDVGAGGPSASLFNAVARGIGIRIVADKGHMAHGFDWQQFVTRRDLYESGEIRSLADVRGKKI